MLPSGDILRREDRTVTCASVPNVPMEQRCSVLGCKPSCRFWAMLQGQGTSWDPARVAVTVPGCSTIQDTRALPRMMFLSKQLGRACLQPKQGEGGEGGELSLPCTVLLHMGKLRHG